MAGTEVGSLYYDLNIDDKNLKKQLDDADKSVKSFGDHVSAYWGNSVDASRKFGLALAAVGAGVVAFGVSSVKAFEDSQNKIAQTNAVLKSTGEAAGVTADQVTKLATALERQTRFSDEDIRSVENLLLTFTSIGKDIFPQATKTVLDMATALGEDTKSASIQLGKALQDPILGVTALRRVGVNFNSAQQEVIANLVNTGRAAEAQQMILKELNKEFGGSAVAAGQTLAGRLDMLKNQFNNVQEAIGGILSTVATPFLDALLKWFDRVGGVDGVLKLLRQELDRLRPYLPVIAGVIAGMLVPALVSAAIAAGEFILTLAPWAALGAGVVIVAQHMGITWSDVGAVLQRIKPYFVDLWSGIKNLDDLARSFIQQLKDLWQWFSNLTVVIIIGQYITQVFVPAVMAIASAIWQNLFPALMQLWDALMRLWNALNPALTDALKIVGAILLGAFLVALWAALSVLNILIQVFSAVVSAISMVIGWIANLIGWFGNLVGTAYNIIRTIASILWNLPNAFRDVVGMLWSIAGGIAGGILHAVGNLGGLLYNAGRDLIAGMINGITDKFKELAGAVKNAVGNAVGAVKGFLGIHSPSTVFHEIGQNVTQGFVNGIQSSAHLAANAMSDFSSAIISPNVSINPAGSTGAKGNTSNRFGDTVVNIGTVQDRQDADYILNRLDQNQRLQIRGVSPV